MMKIDSKLLIKKIENIKPWRRNEQRAPHKPLLILLAISYLQNEKKRLLGYVEIEQTLKKLLQVFGPSRKSYHPEYPFWRLQKDGFWEVKDSDKLEVRKSNTDAKKSELIKYDIHGGFTEAVFKLLISDQQLTGDIIEVILNSHFPRTLHNDILQEIGLSIYINSPRKKRDHNFNDKVLKAYQYKCAICGFDIKYNNKSIALEAAHIKWHAVGGPSIESNGLALCSQHHDLFDFGIFTIDKKLRLMLSDKIEGSEGYLNELNKYNHQQIIMPILKVYVPKQEYLKWHHKEVFKSPARSIG